MTIHAKYGISLDTPPLFTHKTRASVILRGHEWCAELFLQGQRWKIHNGTQIQFWKDCWLVDGRLSQDCLGELSVHEERMLVRVGLEMGLRQSAAQLL